MLTLVNGISANHPSAKHVLYGHLSQLAKWTSEQHSFLVLVPFGFKDNPSVTSENVSYLAVSKSVKNPIFRNVWETIEIPKIIRQHNASLYFTPTGTTLRKSPVPQISLAQNPWCFMDAVPKTAAEKFTAMAQRHAYRNAQKSAALMTYNSEFMRDLYLENSGLSANRSTVAYQGIDSETHQVAEELRGKIKRQANTIVAVSVMACWKGADRLVQALAELIRRGINAKLRLVGPWPDHRYETSVKTLIEELRVQESVVITGKVSRQQLYKEMASATVFALPSFCESFGIPAVEAQAFGTPVVGSSTTAMPEIGGAGGEYCDPVDVNQLANLLERQLSDPHHWQTLSEAARRNAAKYKWETCSQPLMQMFDLA